ncbi:MAG: hypothetical protein LBD27_07435 [Tannerella sp.]|jgi:hypothetical protein|nr:hypothetical protein [Tannerella sp.]
MPNSDFIPRKEGSFHAWIMAFFAYLLENLQRFGIVEDTIIPLVSLKQDFDVKYVAATTPSTRTAATVLAKNRALGALKTAMRVFIKEYLTYNHLVTDEDRRNLGLPVYKTGRTPHPVPTTYPVFTVDTSVIRCLTIHFRDSTGSGKAKPFGVHGVEIKWGYSQEPVVNPESLPYSAFDTRSPYTFEFPGDKRGATVWFVLRWESTRGDKGPWSEIVNAIVP